MKLLFSQVEGGQGPCQALSTPDMIRRILVMGCHSGRWATTAENSEGGVQSGTPGNYWMAGSFSLVKFGLARQCLRTSPWKSGDMAFLPMGVSGGPDEEEQDRTGCP
jgi:hypothetical protein